MTHLSPDELKRWFEHGQADDRERVITHLADCGECRKALSAMASVAETVESTPALTAPAAIPHGYAARRPAPAAGGWLVWMRPVYGLAAVAVVLVVAAFWLARPAPRPGDGSIRSSELLAVSPVGPSDAVEFRWESPFDAARYRLTIHDAKGGVVLVTQLLAPPLVLDPQTRQRLAPGDSYSWRVAALDGTGDVIAESRPATFRYQP